MNQNAMTQDLHHTTMGLNLQPPRFYWTADIQASTKRRFLDYIRTGLNELVDLQIIKKTDEKGKHYILDLQHLVFLRGSRFFGTTTLFY